MDGIGDGMLDEPVLEPRGEFGMRLRAGPVAIPAHALHHVFEAVEHEPARADGRVENLVVECRRSKADHELPDMVRRAMQADVLRAARFGQRGLDGVAEQVGLEQTIFVQLGHEADDLPHVSACNIVGEVRVAEDFLDQNELILNLGREIAFPDLAGLAQDAGVEGKNFWFSAGRICSFGKPLSSQNRSFSFSPSNAARSCANSGSCVSLTSKMRSNSNSMMYSTRCTGVPAGRSLLCSRLRMLFVSLSA